jgi:hypothetical protein
VKPKSEILKLAIEYSDLSHKAGMHFGAYSAGGSRVYKESANEWYKKADEKMKELMEALDG